MVMTVILKSICGSLNCIRRTDEPMTPSELVKTGMRIFPTNSELYRLYGEIGRRD